MILSLYNGIGTKLTNQSSFRTPAKRQGNTARLLTTSHVIANITTDQKQTTYINMDLGVWSGVSTKTTGQ